MTTGKLLAHVKNAENLSAFKQSIKMWNEVSCKIIYAENSVYMYSIWFRKNTGYMYIVILLVGFD